MILSVKKEVCLNSHHLGLYLTFCGKYLSLEFISWAFIIIFKLTNTPFLVFNVLQQAVAKKQIISKGFKAVTSEILAK